MAPGAKLPLTFVRSFLQAGATHDCPATCSIALVQTLASYPNGLTVRIGRCKQPLTLDPAAVHLGGGFSWRRHGRQDAPAVQVRQEQASKGQPGSSCLFSMLTMIML